MRPLRFPVPILLLVVTLAFQIPSGTASETPAPATNRSRLRRKTSPQKSNATAAETKIVGGTTVTDKLKYPFFLEWEDNRCGASLIWDDIALSAAHCEKVDHPFGMRMFMLSTDSDTGLLSTIERQVSHPLYNGNSGVQDYDVMILKLHKSALVDDNGQPTGAQLIELNRDPAIPAVGDALVAMGFGKTDPDLQPTSPTLQDVELQAFDNQRCLQHYAYDFVAQLMFCAGVPGGGKDTCQGDSGGPIIHKESGTQVGVVSYGIGCAQANYAGVNTRLSALTTWIDQQICTWSDQPPARCPPRDPVPPVGKGMGHFSIRIDYDGYPQETAWILTFKGTKVDGYRQNQQLFVSTFHNGIAVNDVVQESFQDMPAGRYRFQIGDEAGDGTCCQYGDGFFVVWDDTTDRAIWTLSGDQLTGHYKEVMFDVDATTGHLTLVEVHDDYQNSWERLTPVNHPPSFDQQWPGALPVADTFAVTVNMKYDKFPLENTWELLELDDIRSEWTTITTVRGRPSLRDQLVSTEIAELSTGWYRLVVKDSAGDGQCCTYRRGWVSLTAPLLLESTKALAWGNNGEYGSQAEVFVFFNADGMVSQVRYTDPVVSSTTTDVGK